MRSVNDIRPYKRSFGTENRRVYPFDSFPAGIIIAVACAPVKMSRVDMIFLKSLENFHLAYCRYVIYPGKTFCKSAFSFIYQREHLIINIELFFYIFVIFIHYQSSSVLSSSHSMSLTRSRFTFILC